MPRVTPLFALAIAALMTIAPARAQEVSVQVKADDTVVVTSGFELEQVTTAGSPGDAADTSRMTVIFPEQKPAVYELESEEDYILIVDGWLPEGSDILLEAANTNTGEAIEGFEHVIRGGDWLIDAQYMNQLPAGEVTISATLRTPDRRDAKITHAFYILEPNALAGDQEPDWFDWELDDLTANRDRDGAPFEPGEGFMTFEPPADARVYYVSSSGSDANDGLSESRPLKTLRAGYSKLRDDSGDWVLLKAGDVFEGSFGVWAKSGISPTEPLHVGVYGEGDRPLVLTQGGTFWRGFSGTYNVRIDGIHAVADARLNRPEQDVTWHEAGMSLIGTGGNILVHDVKLEGFTTGIVFQGFAGGVLRNIAFYRTIVNNSFSHWDPAIGSHSQGIYADMCDNLQFVECTFDRNGWNPGLQNSVRTKYNHNLYIQDTCTNVVVRRNIITRGSSHGLQLRPGGDIIDNLFVRNALAFFVQENPSMIVDNVIIGSDDINAQDIRGHGIMINPTTQATVANNIITAKEGRAGWMPAIQTTWTQYLQDLPSYNVDLHDNVIWDWNMDVPHNPIMIEPATHVSRYNNAIDGVVSETGTRVTYKDPNVGFDAYVEGGLSAFLQEAVMRRRGEWDDKFSAPKFNAYMRDGFSPAGTGGSGDY